MLGCLEKALHGRGYLTCALNEAKPLDLCRGEEEAGEIARATKGTCVEIYQGMSHWEATLEGSVVFLHVLQVRHRMLLYSRLSLQGYLCREQLGRQK